MAFRTPEGALDIRQSLPDPKVEEVLVAVDTDRSWRGYYTPKPTAAQASSAGRLDAGTGIGKGEIIRRWFWGIANFGPNQSQEDEGCQSRRSEH